MSQDQIAALPCNMSYTPSPWPVQQDSNDSFSSNKDIVHVHPNAHQVYKSPQSLWVSYAQILGSAAHHAGTLYKLPALNQGADAALAFARLLQEMMCQAGPTPHDQPRLSAISHRIIHGHIQVSIAQGCICS